MIGTLEKEDLLKALGEDVDKINKDKKPNSIDIAELTRIVSHNAQVAQDVTTNLATEITMTNIVLKNLMAKLGVDVNEIVSAAQDELLSRASQEKAAKSDHPEEATVFGGSS